MLGVVDHLAAVAREERHGLGDQREVLLRLDPESAPNVKIPGLAKDRHGGRLGFDEREHARILVDAELRHPRGAKRGEPGVAEPEVSGPREELLVLRVRPRPAAFDVVDAELVELLRR